MAPQHMEALERAQRIRLQKAALKHKIKGDREGRVLAAVLAGEHGQAGASFRVVEALTAATRIGPAKAHRIIVMSTAGCGGERRVDELTDRQRAVLATAVREYMTDPKRLRERDEARRRLAAARAAAAE